jgi:4-hydroxy-4-methyl-2-oxoglutarate aldolase
MEMILDATQLEALRQFSSPTISNAVEMFDVRPRNEGFLLPEIRCLLPNLGRMAGYAFTAKISADLPASGTRKMLRPEYWEATQSVPAPRIAVIQDLDNPPGMGSFWGEVNSSIHGALGFIGTVTNGSARDLDEMESLGFFAFAGTPSVSHAYVHLVDCGGPVRVGGAVVRPGDLLHGDRHGVVIVPAGVAGQIADAAREVEEAERELISYCRAPEFSLNGLKAAAARLEERFLEIARRRAVRRP